MYDKLNSIEKIIFDVLALVLLVFYAYAAVIRPMATQYHRGIYVLITYILIFLTYKSRFKLGNFNIGRAMDFLFIGFTIFSVGYWTITYFPCCYRYTPSPFEYFVAPFGVVVSIEVARRVVGKAFVSVGIIMFCYGIFGQMAPDLISHSGATFRELCHSIFMKSDGLFGIMTNVLATYVLPFILFGAFLEKCGAFKFFVDWPLAAFAHRAGGPAKASVITSGLFGSLSGSPTANTVSTGKSAIPVMKKAGFKPHTAGGIVPAASIGGAFLPPVMGAGGFIMAELTGIPYERIFMVTVFPALLYFFSVFMFVHFEAKKNSIKGGKTEKSAFHIFKEQWYYILPLIIVACLIIYGFSPGYSAVIGLASCIYISWIGKNNKKNRIDLSMAFIVTSVFIVLLINTALGASYWEPVIPVWAAFIAGIIATIVYYIMKPNTARPGLAQFMDATRSGVENSLKIGATLGVIGIIIGVLTFSGLVLTFADIMIELAGGYLIATIFIIVLASLVLGIGVPVTAAYLITAIIAVPAITHLGVNEIAAHMIVYWLCLSSNITPPFCIPAFQGATIAGAEKWKTALASLKFGQFLFIGALLFAYVPAFSLLCPSETHYMGFDQCSVLYSALIFTLILAGTFLYTYIMSFHWFYFFTRLFKKKHT